MKYTTKAFWLDLADRASKTFAQNFVVFLGAGVAVTAVPWTDAFESAAIATLATVLLALINTTAISSGVWILDAADRAARTFLGSFAGAIPLTGGFNSVNWGEAAAIASTVALASVLTSVLTSNLGASKGLPTTAPVSPGAHRVG